MNNKLSFISGNEPEPLIEKAKQQSEYSEIVSNLDRHYKLKGSLNVKWNSLMNNPEYDVVSEDDPVVVKIKSMSDQITIASVGKNKKLAEDIVELMNHAYREGAKQFINILEDL